MILLLSLISISFGAPDFSKAEKEIHYVKPSEVKAFPPAVRKALDEEKCLIPTVPGQQASGWVKGKFADKRQTDWAVLCSSEGRSKIKVIWGGRDFACPDAIAPAANKAFLQASTSNKVAFSRSVSAVPFSKVVWYLKKAKKEAPKSFEQDGIADVFNSKGSTVYYCSNGKWQRTVGKD